MNIQFLRENTKALRSCIVELSRSQPVELTFTLIAMDMDDVEKFRIRDGKISISQLERMPDDKVRAIMLEGFEGEAWKLADEPLPFEIYESVVRIRKEHINTSEVHGCEAEIRQRVLDRSPSKMVIQCVDEDWQAALLLHVLGCIKAPALSAK